MRLLVLGILLCSPVLIDHPPSSGLPDSSTLEIVRELLERVGVLQDLLDQAFQFLGAVDLGQQVAEFVAGFQQLAQRLDLLDDVGGIEVVQRAELQLDGHLAAVALQRVFHLQVQARRHPRHDLVEVVAVDLDELAVLQGLQRLGRVAREIAQNADDEGKLLLHDRPLGFHFVSDVHARRAHPLQLFVDAFCHYWFLRNTVDRDDYVVFSGGEMPTSLNNCKRAASSGINSASRSGSGIRPQRTACSKA